MSVVLGAVQGVTEFLPVSSDGHLALFALLLGWTDMPLTMTVLLHLGTLLATLLVFRADVRELLVAMGSGLTSDPRGWMRSEDGRTVIAILVASVPTAIVGLLLEEAVESWTHVPWIVGVCLLATAGAVLSTKFTADRATMNDMGVPIWHAILIGIAQGAAVLPGLSRSGSTIAVAMLLGTAGPASFRLSFLLSLPAVAGAVMLKLRNPSEVVQQLGPTAMVGAILSFFVGWVSLLLLRRLVDQGRFWAFAVYLIPLGFFLIGWDLMAIPSSEAP